MLQLVAEIAIEADDLAFREIQVVDQISGPQTMLAQLAQFQPRRHARAPRCVPEPAPRSTAAYIDAHIDIMADGLRSGRTAARIVADRTIEQLGRLLAIPIEEAIVPAMSQVATDADRERVRDVVREVVYPADRRLLDALTGPYYAATRERPGLVSAPDGEQLYRHGIRRWTSLDMEPAGRSTRSGSTSSRRSTTSDGPSRRPRASAATSRAYRRKLADGPGQPGAHAPRRSSRAPTSTSPRRRRSRRASSAGCRAPAARSARSRRSRRRTPRSRTTSRPPLDVSRPGIYYVNTYDLPSRTYSKLASTTFHEAIPGHHFQISLEMEHPGLNVFRRLGARAAGGGAYVEGWGLYAERLADELGLYRTPGERFGMLDAQAWRASRLIVDSGMHALGWSRQQSIDWLLDTGLSETDAVDRDRPLHRVARPGALVHDRHARDPPAAPRARGPRRRALRPEVASTTSSSATARSPSRPSPRSCPPGSRPAPPHASLPGTSAFRRATSRARLSARAGGGSERDLSPQDWNRLSPAAESGAGTD